MVILGIDSYTEDSLTSIPVYRINSLQVLQCLKIYDNSK